MNLLLDNPLDDAPPPAPRAPAAPSPLAAWRYRWTAVAVAAAVIAPAVPGIWLLNTPKYSATATIQISPIIPVVLQAVQSATGRVEFYGDFLNTQVGIILDPRILNRVLDRREVQDSAWYKAESKLSPLTRLRRGVLSVRQRPRTQLIDVTATTKAPADAALLANAVVSAYMGGVGTGDGGTGDAARAASAQATSARADGGTGDVGTGGVGTGADDRIRDKIRARMKLLRDAVTPLQVQLQGQKQRINDIIKVADTASPTDTLASIEFDLRYLMTQRRTARMRKEAAERVLAMHNPTGGSEPAPATSSAPASAVADSTLLGDAKWVELNETIDDLEFQIKQKEMRLGDDNPVLVRLRARLKHTRKQRERRADTLADNQGAGPGSPGGIGSVGERGAPAGGPIAAARREVETHGHWIELYEKEIAKLESQRKRVRDFVQDLETARQEYADTKAEHDKVTSVLRQLEVESQTPGNISRLGLALVPELPTRDRRFLLTVMAIGGGLALGFAAAYLRAMADPSVQNVGQVQALVGSPFLGVLPEMPGGAVADVNDVRFAEQMRIVRTALMERLKPDGDRSLLITSAGSGEGKTTMAIHLAYSLARLGQRVLLMDADFRRADLGARLDRARENGLKQVLDGDITAAEAIVPTEIAGVDLLPAGAGDSTKGRETLANGVFSAHLEQLAQSYDTVIIDGPPVLAMADAQILAGRVSGVLMTVRATQCRRDRARAACDQLEMVGGRIIGVVLNGVKERNAYGYDYGYEYGHAAGPPRLTDHKPSDSG